MTARFQLSAGGVVCRRNPAGPLEVALIISRFARLTEWALSHSGSYEYCIRLKVRNKVRGILEVLIVGNDGIAVV